MSELFGRYWAYPFRTLDLQSEEAGGLRFVATHQALFAQIAKNLDDLTKSEWIARCYLAGRLIMASTLYLNTYLYCTKTNARAVTAFLQYYAALFTMRSVLLLSPIQDWKDGELLRITHSKAINLSSEIVGRICGSSYAQQFKQKLLRLKAHRELISYIAPLSGDNEAPELDFEELVDMCTLLAEIAQLQSEILEGSLHKHGPKGNASKIILEKLEAAFRVELEGLDFTDFEDGYRLQLLEKWNVPFSNVRDLISEGAVDEFFGTWTRENGAEPIDTFDPDENNRVIFDLP